MKLKKTRLQNIEKKKLQIEVLERDGFSCKRCGVTTTAPPHHIKFYSRGGEDVSENMICLCMKCHSGIHSGLINCYGTAKDHVFSLTSYGSDAVKRGVLRKAINSI